MHAQRRSTNRTTALAAPETCQVSFWHFAGPVIAGSAAARVATWATAKAYGGTGASAERTASVFAGLAAFWLVGGLTWVAVSRRAA